MAMNGFRTRLTLTIACALTASCSTATTPTYKFTGSWSYARSCNQGHYVGMDFKQNGTQVTGDWSIGTDLRGNDGKLLGTVREDKLYVRYCSEDGGGYEACPKFGDEDDYFVIRNGELVRYQRFGHGYKESMTLHR